MEATLIADISSKFVNLPPGDVDREIMDAERRICELLGIDLSALWQWSGEAEGFLKLTHLYSVQEGPQAPGRLKAEDFPWCLKQMLAGRIVSIASLDELPEEAAIDRESCRKLGIKSNLSIPLSVGGASPVGALGLNTVRATRSWDDALVKRLQLVAQIFANALARKLADQSLRESEELNRVTFEQAAVGIAHVGIDGRWLRVNDKLCAIVGYPREELLQLTFQDITHPDDLATDLIFVGQLISGEINICSVEKRYLGKNGSHVWVNLSVSIVRHADGEPWHFISVIEDITERKRKEAETHELRNNLAYLARVNTLGALSGSLAHELNQPLGIILTNAQAAQEILYQGSPDLAEIQSILVDIVKADRRAGEVIDRLRALFKQGPVSLQPVLLNQIIEEVLNLTRADLVRRGVAVDCELDPDLPQISGDRVQIQQLVLNLIVNAADAVTTNAQEARRVHIQATLHDGRVRVSVCDNGVGLPEDVQRLFQPFYTTKTQGLGLGLAICRSIAEAHAGRIWAEPNFERGAVFHFELPVAAAPKQTMNSAPGIVYILDDEPEMVKALTRLLRANRFEVRGFTSGHAFLEACQPQETACLVLDVAMPELNGLELQQRLTHQGILIPIIFLTGHGDIPMSVRAIKAGATDFLTKPVDSAALIQAVRTALQAAEVRRQTIAENEALASRLASLTPREREVMEHVVSGQLNKQIAYDLGTGEQNIKLHRAHIMKKMGVDSLADLVRAAGRLGIGK